MQFAEYLELTNLTAANGYTPLEARYDVAASGSWFLVVEKAGHTFRILWHGPAQQLSVGVALTAGPRRRATDWEEKWRSEPDVSTTPQQLLAFLDSEAGRTDAGI